MNFKITEDDLAKPSTRLLLAIQSGDISGAKIISKFGYNFAVGTGTPQTIWDGTPANTDSYTYPLDLSPGVVDVFSGNALDIGQEIKIIGLNAEGYEVEEVVILNGTTPITTTTEFWRVFRAYNDGSSRHEGEVFMYVSGQNTDPFLVMNINADAQQSLFAGFTIPKGYTGYSFNQFTSTGKGKETRVSYQTRLAGKVFRTKKIYVAYESVSSSNIPFAKIPELTDIEAKASSDANNTNVSASFDILLIKND